MTRTLPAPPSRVLWSIVRWGAILTAATVALFPFFWMLRLSVSGPDSVVLSGIDLLPGSWDLTNFARAWSEGNIGRAMLNGAIVTVGILLCQLITCVPAAYAFAKVPFPGRAAAFAMVIGCLLIPTQANAMPLYLGLGFLGLGNTMTALILPFVSSAFGIFLIRQHMLTIPDALLEAARADGLGTFSTLWRVVVPVSMPAIATFSVFSIFVHWNDYLWPLLVARDPALHTPPLALAMFQQAETGQDFGALAAGALIITVPIVLLYLLAQRSFEASFGGGELPG
ncbi:carbohydrate ABC transporter permease [Brevibacterium casei]|uniref:carbohydrate ABC transporter permease n=1 Tax=Brevibacterium casei TaxID=33889 RepID=UPI00223C25FC|nr:carbohydrate ABC transporter permease [Brevibacterium casei]MCT1550051.1 carbohydrate ABC transporter permease [Brevibacterium casei]MCT1559266.1 carbohydrate ABC transporter permease [Brevibacterium casei]MCT2207997.1 carbohydrate ABC transporter permease [Brevibacterium casei]